MKQKISLIIPAFKAGGFIKDALQKKIEILEKLYIPYEIIVVVDGTDEGTKKALQGFKNKKNIIVYYLPKNYGKGYAVRYGMMRINSDFVGYMDVDNDIEPNVLRDGFLAIMAKKYDAILPSKRHYKSKINYPTSRKFISKIYNKIITTLFQLNCTDTQLGAKFYSKELLDVVLPQCRINGFAFELEMLTIAVINGFGNFLEIPVTVNLKTQSTIAFSHGIHVCIDTLMLLPRLRHIHDKKKHK